MRRNVFTKKSRKGSLLHDSCGVESMCRLLLLSHFFLFLCCCRESFTISAIILGGSRLEAHVTVDGPVAPPETDSSLRVMEAAARYGKGTFQLCLVGALILLLHNLLSNANPTTIFIPQPTHPTQANPMVIVSSFHFKPTLRILIFWTMKSLTTKMMTVHWVRNLGMENHPKKQGRGALRNVERC